MKPDLQKICPDCFSESMKGGKCSRCGYERAPEKMNNLQLPQFFVLYDRYILGKVIGSGGFGITYKAYDMLNNTLCAVKEFVPLGISARYMDGVTLQPSAKTHRDDFEHGKKRFLEEAEILKKLSSIPEVVRITDYFSENNTVYFVMEFLSGVTLKRMVQAMGGRIPAAEAISLTVSIARALEQVHRRAGIFHRDISPENIMMTADGKIKIIDFGSAKYLTSEKSQTLSVVLKPGFAPPEQYSSSGKQGSYTDVYALAGTFYYMVSGVMIPEAPDRLSGAGYTSLKDLNLGISPGISDGVDRALDLNYRRRTQTAARFAAELAGKEPSKEEKNLRKERAVLTGCYFHGKKRQWELPPGRTLRVGRSRNHSEIILENDTRISKLHFEIRYQDHAFYIRDRSTNGVYVGKRRLEKNRVYRIQNGDTFAFGNQIYEFRVRVI